MTFPIEIKLGGATISLHLIFETLGFVIGFRYFLFLRNIQKDRITDTNRTWIIVGAAFGAFLFSRIIGSLENPAALLRSRHPLLSFYANKTVVGALLGGLLGVELTKKWIREPTSSGDLFTYPLILAMIIGRIGCFTSGLTEDTYGAPTSAFPGIDFGDGIPRHPVTLYEITFLILLWGLLSLLERRTPLVNGMRFQLFMIAYLSFRFMLDFLKPHYVYFAGLGIIQLTCALGLLYYARTLYRLFFRFSAITQYGK